VLVRHRQTSERWLKQRDEPTNMLHAPTDETKQKSDPGKTNAPALLERELHPRLGASAPTAWALRAGSGVPPSSPVVQRRQQVAYLHRMYGNLAVLRMLDRSLAAGSTLAAQLGGGALQTKLTINQPGDAYEREADRVADAAMRMTEPVRPQAPMVQIASAPSPRRRCDCGGSEGECGACKEERGAELQHAAQPGSVEAVPPILYEVVRSPGQPLSPETRAFFEPRFGYNVGQVRIHTDARAAESARAVNALAYAVADHIVFGVGQYAPQTSEGAFLLAHELAHTAQSMGTQRPQVARQTAPSSGTPSTPTSEKDLIDDAYGRASLLVIDAKARINRLKDLVSAGKLDQATKEDAHTLAAAQNWLHIDAIARQAEFIQTLTRVAELMTRNITAANNPVRHPSPDPCATLSSFAWSTPGDPNDQITYCNSFFTKGPQCRRNVVIHERFHLAGAHHGEDPSGKATTQAQRTTTEALDSADDLMDLVKDVMNQEIFVCNTLK
jgi:Domain of unknown function (DUF4157)